MNLESHRLIKPLGRGSFGEVWRVEYCKPGRRMGQFFAAKISYLPADHQDIAREMVEYGPIITRLRHSHIIQLFSGEGFAEGRLVLVMELADGSLMDRWKEFSAAGRVFPPRELVVYVRQAADALDYIHGHQLIHGGINPGDILLVNGQVRIADPGPPVSPDDPFVRIQIANLSKAICMAPERKLGTNYVHSDQYALAATYAWLRVGRPLLGLDTRPTDIRSVNCLSRPEQDVLVRALSSIPQERYPSCIEFADALQSAVVGEEKRGRGSFS